MSTNKHATMRYQALDQCFANTGRRYFMEDLIDVIDSTLFEFTGKPSSIKFSWELLSDKRMSRIKYQLSGVSVFNEEDWNKMFEFMVQYVPKFEAAFKKPIQLLSRK